MKKQKGFTLIEIIVVVAILATLMAVAVPSILKYITITDDVKATNEAYACVTASNYFGAKLYKDNVNIIVNDDFKNKILKQADVKGKLIEVTYNDFQVSQLIYKYSKEIIVLYDGNKYIIVDATKIPDSVGGTMNYILNLEFDNELNKVPNSNTSKGRTQTLQKLYIQNLKKYLPVSNKEIDMLVSLKYNKKDAEKLVWKPIYDSDGKAFLVADSKTSSGSLYGAAQGPLIYYNNNYYYFKGPIPNKAYSKWVQDGQSSQNQGFTKEYLDQNCVLIE